jgi:hypothetical protein
MEVEAAGVFFFFIFFFKNDYFLLFTAKDCRLISVSAVGFEQEVLTVGDKRVK